MIEPSFRRYGGRPHRGEPHALRAEDLATPYPQWEAFHAVRRRLDPEGRFLNPRLRRCIEAATA
jgi:FAD/FMN-containing dehydrogenase